MRRTLTSGGVKALDSHEREVPFPGGGGGGTVVFMDDSPQNIRASDFLESDGMEPDDDVSLFFERYASALLARDARAIAGMYAVPGLIVFPGAVLPITDARQTEDFFASTWGQYDGVDAVEQQVALMGSAPGTVWADVTWSYGGRPQERFCYQLLRGPDGYQIVVLTPLA